MSALCGMQPRATLKLARTNASGMKAMDDELDDDELDDVCIGRYALTPHAGTVCNEIDGRNDDVVEDDEDI